MKNFEGICRGYNLVKLKIKYKWKNREREVKLQDILPANFCVLAFHNIYPYLETICKGGSFNWVNYDEDVIVNCPSVEGVAMYVKPIVKSNSPDSFQIEVMKNNCHCFKNYSLNDKFYFNFEEENGLRYRMLDTVFPFFNRFLAKDYYPIDFSCIYKENVISYKIELKQEDLGVHL